MKISKTSTLLLCFLFLLSCDSTKKITSSSLSPTDDHQIEVIILQLNDTYEIAGLEGGAVGGMARIATLKKQLLKENPNTLFVHAGDFLYPSLIGTMKFEGEAIKGRQMVEVMNQTGVDLIAFGNHEFDLREKELQKRLNESSFTWLGTNVRQQTDKGKQPFYKDINGKQEACPDSYRWTVRDNDGTQISIGFFGATINSNPKNYVFYQHHTKRAIKEIKKLRADTDLILGLTHLEIDQDTLLARKLQTLTSEIGNIPLFMGGHDHDNMIYQIGTTRITKADANARTAYVHRLSYHTQTKKVDITSSLIEINQWLSEDPVVKATVDKWTNIADQSFKKAGFDPYQVIATLDTPLDGRESSIRNRPTNLGQVTCEAMSKTAKSPVATSIINSGSFRVDDQLAGELRQYDIIRTLPYGGKIIEVDLKGSLLKAILDEGWKNKGKGGFLQWDQVERGKRGRWKIQGTLIDVKKEYHIALNDYLLLGLDIKILTEANPGIIKITKPDKQDTADLRNDIRKAIIDYLQ